MALGRTHDEPRADTGFDGVRKNGSRGSVGSIRRRYTLRVPADL